MSPAAALPASAGWGESFPNYAQQVKLWRRVANSDVAKEAREPALQMGPITRNACIALGDGRLAGMDAAGRLSQEIRYYCAPEALNMICKDVPFSAHGANDGQDHDRVRSVATEGRSSNGGRGPPEAPAHVVFGERIPIPGR